MKKIFRYIKFNIEQIILKNRIKKLNKTKKILILQLASGLGDYISARKYLYEHINKGLREEYNIIVIGTKRWKQFADYFDKDNFDILIYIDDPYGKKLIKSKKIIKHLPKSDIYIDIIMVSSDNYIIADYINSNRKYRMIDYSYLDDLQKNKGYIYDEGYKWLFNNLKYYYKQVDNTNSIDIWKLNKKDNIDEILKKHIEQGYIAIFAEGYSRGSLSNEQLKYIIDYLINNTQYDILLFGIIKRKKIIEKFIVNSYGNNNDIKKRIYNYYRQIKTYQIPKIVAESSLLITTDTAPYHFGIQMNKKTICITNFDYYTLNNYQTSVYNIIVEREKLEEIPITDIMDKFKDIIGVIKI